jgi:UDP:flavonoid glycosyltransferase YjiC (YdhE family)
MRLEIPAIQQVADLFEAEAKLICGRPELDVYGQRANGTYIGPINNIESGDSPNWPAGDGRKVFVYLKPRYPHFEPLLKAFAQTSARFLIFSPGIANAVIQRHTDKCLHFSTTPLRMAEVRTDCDAAVCHAGGTTDVMLEAGKPLLLLPMQMEQTMTSRRVESLGAGLHLPFEGNPGEIGKLLKSVLTNACYRRQAEAYATHQQCHGHSDAVGAVVERFQQLLARVQGA